MRTPEGETLRNKRPAVKRGGKAARIHYLFRNSCRKLQGQKKNAKRDANIDEIDQLTQLKNWWV